MNYDSLEDMLDPFSYENIPAFILKNPPIPNQYDSDSDSDTKDVKDVKPIETIRKSHQYPKSSSIIIQQPNYKKSNDNTILILWALVFILSIFSISQYQTNQKLYSMMFKHSLKHSRNQPSVSQVNPSSSTSTSPSASLLQVGEAPPSTN